MPGARPRVIPPAGTDPEPKFANHSKVESASRRQSGDAKREDYGSLAENDIDFFFGWDLKKLAETMRLHYAGLDRVLRLNLRWVTAYV